MATLRARLRTIRRMRGYTQKQLQACSGVPYTTISRIETGAALEITTKTLTRLAAALGVSNDYLLGVSDVPLPPCC
jgi:transcriptional regulator with XRE-family HTH domain